MVSSQCSPAEQESRAQRFDRLLSTDLEADIRQLALSIEAERRPAALDHPICELDAVADTARPMGTAHAYALRSLLRSASGTDEGARHKGVRLLQICKVLIAARAPLFSAAPGTGLEDDYGYAAELFVRKVWPSQIRSEVAELFAEYVDAGFIDLDASLDRHCDLVGGKPPLVSAIRLGNPDAAAALVRAGCAIDYLKAGQTERSVDLLEYTRLTATHGKRQEIIAALTAALMERTLKESAAPTSPAPRESSAPARRRRMV